MSITSSRWSLVLAGLFVTLFSMHASAQQDLTFTPFHANGIYQPGGKTGMDRHQIQWRGRPNQVRL